MKLILTPTEAYLRKQRLWKLYCDWKSRVIRAFYPETGGSDHLLHNWHSCSRNPELADWIRSSTLARYRKLESAMEARDMEREHLRHGAHFRPMWCPMCQKPTAESGVA